MALGFDLKDVIHKIAVKFVPAYLPNAKKKYNLKAVLQTELDIPGIAAKANVYNITTSPKVIEEGLTEGLRLIRYLTADNYRIKTGLFNLGIKVPGEYEGTETHLPAGIFPEVKVTVDGEFRNYIRENVHVVFDGIEDSNGYIGEVLDDATGLTDQVITIGNIATIAGYGLKIESDAAHASAVGIFFADSQQAEVQATLIAVNEPRTLKVIVPQGLTTGTAYTVIVRTQSSIKSTGHVLKSVREVRTDFTVTAQP